MTQDLLSEGEKKFIIDGIRTNIRNDGRQRLDVDSFTIELNILPYCVCSSKVILHSTQVIVGFKLEVCEPDADLPSQGKIQCSVRYSPCSAPWKRNYELESMNFDLSRELQNIMGNSNSINLNDLCIIKNRLCWIIYIDALILENNGNVFDAICLGSNACFKNLIIPNLNIKNIDEYTNKNESNKNSEYMNQSSLFKNTEITKKATINKMRKLQKQKTSKFSGQQLPFQDSIALNSSLVEQKDNNSMEMHRLPQQNDIINLSEIEFIICNNGKQLKGINNLPIIVTMAIMDNNKYFIIDPLYEEELCCDVLIRIAVYSNGNISIIKYGNKSIDPLLIFNMIENGKQSGLKWMEQLNNDLGMDKNKNDNDIEMKIDSINNIDFDTLNLEMFKLNEKDEKNVELEMNKELEQLSFITDSLKGGYNGNINVNDHENKNDEQSSNVEVNSVSKTNLTDKSLPNKTNKIKTKSFLEESSDNDDEMIIVD